MKVHLHASCWNEERMLPFFFRHYDPVVDRYFIHDNGSSDRSLEMLAAHPRVTVLPLVLEGDSLCQAAFEKVNDFWLCSRGEADWVAVCNIDEFFHHPDLPWYLAACRRRGITFIPTRGYEMVSDVFPAPGDDLSRTIRRGARAPHYDKPSFFNPDAITHSGFGMARHTAAPQGRVLVPDRQEVVMLHYKNLGLDYLTVRHAELGARMRELDRKKKWGFQYDPELTVRRFHEFRAAAREVVPAVTGGRRARGGHHMPRPVPPPPAS
jgi:hypothetical protein